MSEDRDPVPPEAIREVLARMQADTTEIVHNLQAIWGPDLAHILTSLADLANCSTILERFPIPANVLLKVRESIATIGITVAKMKGLQPQAAAKDVARLCERSLVWQLVGPDKRRDKS